MKSLERGFISLGHEVLFLEINESINLEEIKKSLESFSPDLCLTHNYYIFDLWSAGEDLSLFLKQKGIQIMSWYWDSPRTSGSYRLVRQFLFGGVPKHIHFLVVDRQHEIWLKERGATVSYLPIGVDTDFFCPGVSQETHELTFVGKPCSAVREVINKEDLFRNYFEMLLNDFTSLILQTNAKRDLPEDRLKQQLLISRDLFGLFFSKTISSRADCDTAVAECLTNAKHYLDPHFLKEFEIYMGRVEFFYSWLQLNDYLIKLLPLGLEVFGGEDWGKKLLPGYSKATPFVTAEKMRDIFRGSQISFCHTKWPFRTGVHERPLLVLASGGFPLTDYRSGLMDLFKPGEIVVYHNENELADLVRYYKTHDSERLEVVTKGRSRVIAEHNYSKRAKSIMQFAGLQDASS